MFYVSARSSVFIFQLIAKSLQKENANAVAIWIKILLVEATLRPTLQLVLRSLQLMDEKERNVWQSLISNGDRYENVTLKAAVEWEFSKSFNLLLAPAHKFRCRNIYIKGLRINFNLERENLNSMADNRVELNLSTEVNCNQQTFYDENKSIQPRTSAQSESRMNDTIKSKLNELSVIYIFLLLVLGPEMSERIKHSWQITCDHQTMLTHRSAKTARFITDFHKLRSGRAHLCHCRKFVYKALIT